MASADEKVLQYLNETLASERALTRVLESQIAVAPRGPLRSILETHLEETKGHASRVSHRLGELGQRRRPLMMAVGLAETVVGQALALGKTPIDLVRGTSGAEKVLKNTKDACATEALEIATYTAIERVAKAAGDDKTAQLAASIRADEEAMLERLLRELPAVAQSVVDGSYDVGQTGAGEAVRRGGRAAREQAKATARAARKVPGVARAEGELKGVVASEGDLAIPRYDSLTAAEIARKLSDLSQIELSKIDAYERKHENRATVLDRIAALRADEPWPGYDELTVAEVNAALDDATDELVRKVRTYERAHKARTGVLEAADRELSNA
jgi:ferritin-like metal-binding protein YciE